MSKPKEILTTGEVARICNVAPRTVSKWFDTGQLRGYRIPGSKDRRIPIAQLIRFMKAYGMPLDNIDTGELKVLIVDRDEELTSLLQKVLHDSAGYDIAVADSAFEAGAIIGQFRPAIAVVDVDLNGIDGKTLSRFVASRSELADTRLIAMGASLTDLDRHDLTQQGFHAVLAKPFSIRQVAAIIEENIAVTA